MDEGHRRRFVPFVDQDQSTAEVLNTLGQVEIHKVHNVHLLLKQQISKEHSDTSPAWWGGGTRLENVDVELRGYRTDDGLVITLTRQMLATVSSSPLYPGIREFLGLPESATQLRYIYPESADVVLPEAESGAQSVAYEEPGWQDLMEDNTPTKYDLGLQVIVDPEGPGILRYFGDVDGVLCAGVELVKKAGTHNGTIDGVQYFRCKEGHGILAPVHNVNVHGVRSRTRAVHGFITMSREDTRPRTSSRSSSISNRASLTSAMRRDRLNAAARASMMKRDDKDTVDTDAAQSIFAEDAEDAPTEESVPTEPLSATPTEEFDTKAPCSPTDTFLRDGGILVTGEDGKAICALIFARCHTSESDSDEDLKVELEFVSPKTTPVGPFPMALLKRHHPFHVEGFGRYFVLPRTKGYSLGFLVLQNNEGKHDGVCQIRCKLSKASLGLFERTDSEEKTARRDTAEGAIGKQTRSASVDIVLEQAPQLCDEFIELFTFTGVDDTRLTLVDSKRRTSVMGDDASFSKAIPVSASMQGKVLTLLAADASNTGDMLVRLHVTRPPRDTDCMLMTVSDEKAGGPNVVEKKRGCIDLLAIGNKFETPRGLITPTALKLWCSANDFLDWRRVFSVNLAVFEENKYSIFRDVTSLTIDADRSPTDGAQLGTGAFGSVSKKELAGIAYAVKQLVLYKDSPGYTFDLVQAFLEAQVLLALRSPCIIPLNSVTWSHGEGSLTMYMVMDYAHGGDFRQYLYDEEKSPNGKNYKCISKPRLDYLVLLRVWREFFSGLKYLHEKHGLIHRDLKPENVVVVRELTKLNYGELRARRDEGGPGTIVRIVDFGQATFGSESGVGSELGTSATQLGGESEANHFTLDFRSYGRGTNGYQAPEMLVDEDMLSYTTRVDVWSAMLVVWESFACRRVFVTEQESFQSFPKVRDYIVSGGGPNTEDFPPFLAAVVKYGCTHNPHRRPDAATLFDIFYHLEATLDWSAETAAHTCLGSNDGDAWVSTAAQAYMESSSQLQRVELPFLFVSSVERLQVAIDSAFADDFGGRFLSYLHIATTSPTFLLPDKERLLFSDILQQMLADAREQPRLHIKVAWEHYGPVLVSKLKNFIAFPGSFEGPVPLPKEGNCELEAIVSLLACFSEFATGAAKTHFLSHDFAEDLINLLRHALRASHAQFLTSWTKIMIMQVLSRFVSGTHTPAFFTSREANADLLTTLADLATSVSNDLLHESDIDARHSDPDPPNTESSERLVANSHRTLAEILQCCTCLCARGPVDSRLFLHKTLEATSIVTAVVKVIENPVYSAYENYNLVLQTSRLLTVWPCPHHGALVAMCYWMLMIPSDCTQRMHAGEPVVSHNRTQNIGTRLHHTLFEAILVQLEVTSIETGLHRLLTVPLLSVWASINGVGSWRAKSICAEGMGLADFQAALAGSIIANDDLDWKPNSLWVFSSGPDGADVVCSLLDLACRGQITEVLMTQVMWTACCTVHMMVVEMEKRWHRGPIQIAKVFTSTYGESAVARGAFSLLPTLINIAEGWCGQARPAMLSQLTTAEIARLTIHRLLAPPCVFVMNLESDCSAIVDYLIEELCLLTANTFVDTISRRPTQHVADDVDIEYRTLFKSLLLLVADTSPVKASAVQRLAAEPAFIETIAEILKASRAVTNAKGAAVTKEEESERKKRLTQLGTDLAPYAVAFLWHHEICVSLFTARGMNVYNVISPVTEIVDLSDVMAGHYPPKVSMGVNGTESWFAGSYKLPMPSSGLMCRLVISLCKVAMEDTFWGKSMISVMVATGQSYPRGRARPGTTPSNFNLLVHLDTMFGAFWLKAPTASESVMHAGAAMLALWELTTTCYVPKESLAQLDSLTATFLKVAFLSPASQDIEWTAADRLETVVSASQIMKRFWRQEYTLELDCVRLIGNWVSEYKSTSDMLVVNAAQFMQSYTWMLANPGKHKSSDERSPKEEANRRRKIAARKRLIAQWPYRVLDVVTDLHEENELVMLCVHDSHESLLKVPPAEWTPLEDYPEWLMFEIEQRFIRLLDRLTTNSPPVDSMRIGATHDTDALTKLGAALDAHCVKGASLAHLTLFGDGPEPTPEITVEFCRSIAAVTSLATVQLCRFTFRASKKQVLRSNKAAGLAMDLTVALLHAGKRVELYHCVFSDKAGAELHSEMKTHFAPGTLSLGTGGAQLVLDEYSRNTLASKDAAFFANYSNA